MAKEVERKFLVGDESWRKEIKSRYALCQGYVALMDGRSVRVRIKDGTKATLTIKIGANGAVRDEFEYEIPLADAEELMTAALGVVLEKTRHTVEHDGFTWEVDVFGGPYEGLVVAEVEMNAETDQPALPAWIGREVTGDRRYSNQYLASEDVSAELTHGFSH